MNTVYDATYVKNLIERCPHMLPIEHWNSANFMGGNAHLWTPGAKDYVNRAEKMYQDCVRDGMAHDAAIGVALKNVALESVVETQQEESKVAPAVENASQEQPTAPVTPAAQPTADTTPVAPIVETTPAQAAANQAADASKDAEGTFPYAPTSFYVNAMKVARKGVPITPIRPGTKKAFLPDFPTTATTDETQIKAWDVSYPNHNYACVARAEVGGVFFWEVDSPDVGARLQAETGHDIKELNGTFRVRSRQGRGHYYFRHTPQTITTLSNIAQNKAKGGDWSLRVNREYVVGSGSINPVSGLPYQALEPENAPILEAPQWLLDWLLTQVEKEQLVVDESGERRLIPHGQMHGAYIAEAGRLWNRGYEANDVVNMTARWMVANGEPPVDEDKVRKEALSVTKLYKRGEAPESAALALNQGPKGTADVELDTTPALVRPVFPLWAIQGTSLYENFVKPAMDASGNSKHEEFLFFPAMQIMTNYLSGKVEIPMQKTHLNFFIGMISPYGKFFKSTSAELAQEFFNKMGVVMFVNNRLQKKSGMMAEGKVAIGKAGSSEGFGIMMYQINAKNAILYNDEFEWLVSKAGIENSTFSSDILTWWGGGYFSNNVSDPKKSFLFEPNSYTFGWLFCTTDRSFNRLWPRIAGAQSGLPDRMFWIVGPKNPKPPKPYYDPPMEEAAAATRKLIEKAINQKKIPFENLAEYSQMVDGMNPRSMEMTKSLALYLAVDLGLTSITADCIRRAQALVQFSDQSGKFLAPVEADNQQARIQLLILRELKKNSGKMSYRKLVRDMHGDRYGTYLWDGAFSGLVKHEDIIDWPEKTETGRQTRMVGLVKHWEDDEVVED